MSTTAGAIVGLVAGAVLGVGGLMLWPTATVAPDHDAMGHDGMAMPATGNPDHDFMAGMVPHHQDAIDMANTVLTTTDDPQVRALADSILATQAAEIAQMNAWLAAHPQ